VARVTALISSGSAWKTPLTVTTLPVGEEGVLVLRVAGEIDLATEESLRKYIHTHAHGAHRGVVLDYTEVSFLAACGVGLLAEIADQAHVQGVVLRLVAQNRAVLRALEVTGVDGLIPRAATMAEAVAQCSS
jgi:anti-sigma B factor antagonist